MLFKEDASANDMLKGITHSYLLRQRVSEGKEQKTVYDSMNFSRYNPDLILQSFEDDLSQAEGFVKALKEKNTWYISSGLLEEKIARISV